MASASARVILVNMVILLMSKPEWLLQTRSEWAALISGHTLEEE
jgi:hypothetical protein